MKTILSPLGRHLIAAATLAAGAGAQRPSTPVDFRPYLFETADRSIGVMAEWGTLAVPARHAVPRGRQVQLALLRFRSTSRSPGPPIIWLAGGPGLDAIDAARLSAPTGYARLAAMPRLYLALRELGDVIVFDQRGTGYSRPSLKCREPGTPIPLDRPMSASALIASEVHRATACRRLWRERGIDLDGYNSEEMADDVDAIRRALGASRMALVGGSYGAHLGLTTIRRHGDRVAWAVLRNVEGPDDGVDLPATMDTILQHIAEVARADSQWAGVFPDFVGAVREATARLEREPARVALTPGRGSEPASITVGSFDLRHAVAATRGLTQELQQLPARFAAMQAGDYSWLARQSHAARTPVAGNAQQAAVDCADGVSAERVAMARASAAGSAVGAVMDVPWPESCPAWGVRDLGAANRAPVRSNVPVLLISGSLDGLTPPANALDALRTLPNGRHLLVEGVAHGIHDAYFSSPETLPLVLEFARTGRISRDRITVPFRLSPPEARMVRGPPACPCGPM
jgi:pimeloyl-ACP methyl ester carboxylesterase